MRLGIEGIRRVLVGNSFLALVAVVYSTSLMASTASPSQEVMAPHDYKVAVARWDPRGDRLAVLRVALRPGATLLSGDLFARGPSADEWNGLWILSGTVGQARRVLKGLRDDYGWAADGTLVVGNERMVNGEPGAKWLVIGSDGASLREITPTTPFVTEYALSPDGRFIAYLGSRVSSDRKGERLLAVLDAATGEPVSKPLAVTAGGLLWTPDGKCLFCCLGTGAQAFRLCAPGFAPEPSLTDLRFVSNQVAVDDAGGVVFANETGLHVTHWSHGRSKLIRKGRFFAPAFSSLGTLAFGEKTDQGPNILWSGVLKEAALSAQRRVECHPVDFATPIGWSLDGRKLACCDEDGTVRVIGD